MPIMHWTEKMSVGVREIDEDHKQLISVINRLAEDADKDDRKLAVRQSIAALLRYAEFHFAREEKMMTVARYPGIEEHKIEHRDFVAKIKDLSRLFDEDPQEVVNFVRETLLEFLRDWLNHHILIEDKAYQTCVTANPEAIAAAKSFQAAEVWWSR